MAEVADIACPLCGNAGGHLPVRVPSHDESIRNYGALYDGMATSMWKVCGRCGFVHQNPRPSVAALDRFYLAGNYHDHVDVPPDEVLASHAPSYEDEIAYAIDKSGIRTGRVLDIGCGFGVALKVFRDRGWEVHGIEPDAARVAYARRHFGLDMIRHGTFDRTFALHDARKVDLIFTHHAFEHFADLGEVMAGITRVLAPGGYMFTQIPTYRHNRSTMSKLWMNSAHYSLFTHRSFGQLLARHGFEPIAYRYRPWVAGHDQIGHLARFTGAAHAPETFFEDSREVARYLAIVNPIRSAAFLPLTGGYHGYRHFATRATELARAAARVLVEQPGQFLPRAAAYLRERRR